MDADGDTTEDPTPPAEDTADPVVDMIDIPVDEEPVADPVTNLIVGTGASEEIVGTDGNDDILALGGDDSVDAGQGNNVIQGFNGADSLIAGDGSDAIQGRGGDDTIQGFFGEDWVDGNDGNDSIRAGGGFDVAIGGLGEDTIDGRSGDDVVIGGELNQDPLSTADLGILRDGGTLADVVGTGPNPFTSLLDDGAADQLFGSEGQDALFVGAGDVASGGADVDSFALIADATEGDLGPATITDLDVSAGETLLLYFRADEVVDETGITVEDDGDDALVSYQGQVLARVTNAAGLLAAENIGTLQIDDMSVTPTQTGTEEADVIFGTGQSEMINGLGAADQIEGRAGDDTINGGDGNDIVQGNAGDDVISGNAGDDILQGRGENDTVAGDAGNDWINGNDDNDSVSGGADADTVIGGSGLDTVEGGDGDDILFGDELLADPVGTSGLVALQAAGPLSEGVSALLEENFLPTDEGNADTLDGGAGADTLYFGVQDVVTGGADADIFAAIGSSAGADTDVGPAVVTDYVAGEDTLVILSETDNPVITLTADNADALIAVDGNVLMRVIGGAAAITLDDIVISTSLGTDLQPVLPTVVTEPETPPVIEEPLPSVA